MGRGAIFQLFSKPCQPLRLSCVQDKTRAKITITTREQTSLENNHAAQANPILVPREQKQEKNSKINATNPQHGMYGSRADSPPK